jgi:hypothetical protein
MEQLDGPLATSKAPQVRHQQLYVPVLSRKGRAAYSRNVCIDSTTALFGALDPAFVRLHVCTHIISSTVGETKFSSTPTFTNPQTSSAAAQLHWAAVE